MIINENIIKNKIKNLEGIYEKHPDRFEKLRKELIEIVIMSYPEKFRKRARGIQFYIEFELNKYKDPVIRMNRMVELFWDKFYEFNSTINDPAGIAFDLEKNNKKGKILPLN